MADTELAEIAKSLIVPATPATDEAQEPVEEPEQELADEQQTEPDELEEDQEPEDDTEDQDEDDAEEPEGEAYTFKVDGEEVTVSVDDLITNYSIDGTARKRLQEATAARAEAVEAGRSEGMAQAQAEIQTRTAEVETARQQLSQLVGMVSDQLFAPMVQRPEVSMQETDPMGYTIAMEQWRDDQARIQQVQGQIVAATRQQQQAVAQQAEAVKARERQSLTVKRPDLADREKAKEFTGYVRRAQEHFGFSGEEVDAFPDHRGLLALEYAGRALAAEQAQGDTPAQRIVKKVKGRPLPPGAVQKHTVGKQKKQRAHYQKARTTGDYRDVAKTLIVDAPKRR